MVSTNQDFLNRTGGWMDEGFISYKGWKLSAIDMPQYASDQNKFTMFYAVNSSTTVRHFYYASALLSDGYFFYAPTSTQWFAEYGTYTGDATGKAYEMQSFPGVWARDYTAAKVIVNPTSKAVTVNMPGYVDLSGNPATQITVNPSDAAILKPNTQSTQLTAASNNSTPAVSQPFTISGTLTNGTTPLAGATIQLQKNVSGTWTDVAGKTNTTTALGTYNITTSEPTAATYQYRTTYAGNATYQNTTSSVVTVTVRAGAWSPWGSLDGYLTASPAAVSSADGHIDVFGRGSDNALWHRSYANNAWSAWESLDGQLASTTGPAVSSQAAGKLDVFVIGLGDHALWHRSHI